jgi:hypothetical protein
MIKWISVLAAASLAAAPAAAQPVRTAAPVGEAESASGSTFAWVMAAVMVVGVILILTDDDNELPSSP